MTNNLYGQIYLEIDTSTIFSGRYIGKHKFNKEKEKTPQNSLEIYLSDKLVKAKEYIGKRKQDNWLRELVQKNIRPKIISIECCYSESELNEREEYWRQYFKKIYPDLLNMVPGGQGGHLYDWNKETQPEHGKHISEALKCSEKFQKRIREHNKEMGPCSENRRSAIILNSYKKWKQTLITSGIKLCQCGCGQIVNGDHRYINGHVHMSEKRRKEVTLAQWINQ